MKVNFLDYFLKIVKFSRSLVSEIGPTYPVGTYAGFYPPKLIFDSPNPQSSYLKFAYFNKIQKLVLEKRTAILYLVELKYI